MERSAKPFTPVQFRAWPPLIKSVAYRDFLAMPTAALFSRRDPPGTRAPIGEVKAMRIKCPKCGIAADIRETGDGFRLNPLVPMSLRCPVVQDRMRENGRTEDATCEELAREAGRARDEAQRRP
jgi:hypothetical protein